MKTLFKHDGGNWKHRVVEGREEDTARADGYKTADELWPDSSPQQESSVESEGQPRIAGDSTTRIRRRAT